MAAQNSNENSNQSEKVDGVDWNIPQWFPDLDPATINQLSGLLQELLHFNKRLNLISPRTEKVADKVHISDSILAAKEIFKHCNEKEIHDIGSGNGMPGLVMAILDPSRKFYLVESDSRKCEFLKHAAMRLKLQNVEVLNKRLEELPEDSIKCAVSRGFASISKAILAARKPCASGCTYYHLKSDSWSREFGEIPVQILSHWKPAFLKSYRLPDSDIDLAVVYTVKK